MSVQAARAAYNLAYYGGASSEALAATTADLIAAKRAAETPEQTAGRLEWLASIRDERVEAHMATESSLAGRIAHCRQIVDEATGRQRNPEQAENLEVQRAVALRLARRNMNEAEALRDEARAILAKPTQAAALMGVVS